MEQFIGTKIINAKPMNRADYNKFRGWTLPEDENGEDKGFLVEYVDGGNPNTDSFKGYVSWSPEEQFNNSYRKTDGLTIGLAIEAMEKGKKVSRKGWNGKGMFLFLVEGSTFKVNRKPLLGIYEEGTVINYRPHIDMKTVNDEIVTWVASQSDLVAKDWYIIS